MSQPETAARMSIKLIRPYILDVSKSHHAVVVLVFYCSYQYYQDWIGSGRLDVTVPLEVFTWIWRWAASTVPVEAMCGVMLIQYIYAPVLIASLRRSTFDVRCEQDIVHHHHHHHHYHHIQYQYPSNIQKRGAPHKRLIDYLPACLPACQRV